MTINLAELPDDPAVLKEMLAETAGKNEELNSRIGSVINESGKRTAAVRNELLSRIDQMEQDRLRKEEEEADLRERRYMSGLSPSEQANFRAEKLEKEIQDLRNEKQQERVIQAQRELIQDIVRNALGEGMPQNLIDIRSPEHAAVSFERWEKEKTKRELAETRNEIAKMKTQVVEEAADVIRSEGRRVATGTPMTSVPRKETPKDELMLRAEKSSTLARKAKDPIKAAGEFFMLKRQAAVEKNVDLVYEP